MMQTDKNLIHLIDIKTDDISDYKYTSMLLVFPKCSGKCKNCQNGNLQNRDKSKDIHIPAKSIINHYNRLKTHTAIVCAGLEPFDSLYDLQDVFREFVISSNKRKSDFVIYTGYTQEEVEIVVNLLKNILFTNEKGMKRLIIKFGRYDETKTNNTDDIDPILGIHLATSNQYVVSYESNKL